jgi:dihydroorotate dehydrogenase
LNAGAHYIQLHSGLVYAGPGLPKRVNEAILYERTPCTDSRAILLFGSIGAGCAY